MRYQHPKNLEFQTTHSHVANGLAAVDGRSPPTPNKGRIGPKKGQRKEVPILSVWQYANIQAVCRISILEPHLSRLKRNGRSSNEVKTNLRDWRRSKGHVRSIGLLRPLECAYARKNIGIWEISAVSRHCHQ